MTNYIFTFINIFTFIKKNDNPPVLHVSCKHVNYHSFCEFTFINLFCVIDSAGAVLFVFL